MVGMHLGRAPIGHLVGLCVPLSERVALLLAEDGQGLPAGGAVYPLSGHLQAPPPSSRPHVREAGELPALEEPLPHVGHPTLHARLVPGMAHPRRV